jgi:hypothetical protein
MRKYICFIGLLLSSITLFAQNGSKKWTEEYIQQNIAFTKFTARVVTSDFYVCEITVTDINKSIPMPEGFGLNDVSYADNGVGNDLIKGDGVYSSVDQIKFLNGRPKILTKDYKIFDQNYKGKAEMNSVISDGIGCKIRRCGCPCPTFTCRACHWWGWDCLEVYECEIILF